MPAEVRQLLSASLNDILNGEKVEQLRKAYTKESLRGEEYFTLYAHYETEIRGQPHRGIISLRATAKESGKTCCYDTSIVLSPL